MKKYAVVYKFDEDHPYLDFVKSETPEKALVYIIKTMLCNGDKEQIKEFEEAENINLDEASLGELKAALDNCGDVCCVADVAAGEQVIYEY